MPIAQSVKGITDFLQSNQGLITDIQTEAKAITDLANQLDQQRQDGQAALAAVGKTAFAVPADPGTKAAQANVLGQIADTITWIQKSQGDPVAVAALYDQLATLYTALANTYNSLVPQMVAFTQDDVTQLQALLQQATLDAAARQRQADLLAGAVQISKFALGFALKLTA
jgi:hypothetical protein